MDELNQNFGKKLAELRRKHNLQQPEFGQMLSIHPQTVSRYERGLITPGLDILVKISEKFDVSLDWLASSQNKALINNKYIKVPMLENPNQYWFLDELFLHGLTYKNNLNAYVAKNNYMYPAIQKGDIVLINMDYEEPAIDKIVIIRSGSEYILKKIASIDNDSIQLVNNNSNVTVHADKIAGTVQIFCRGNI